MTTETLAVILAATILVPAYWFAFHGPPTRHKDRPTTDEEMAELNALAQCNEHFKRKIEEAKEQGIISYANYQKIKTLYLDQAKADLVRWQLAGEEKTPLLQYAMKQGKSSFLTK